MNLLHQNHRRQPMCSCGHCCLQPQCCHCCIVHIMLVKLIVINIFSSFDSIDLMCSMLADCCLPWRQEWGIMARPWGGGSHHGPPVQVFYPALASSHLGTTCVRCPPTPCPTNNQPTTHPVISVEKNENVLSNHPLHMAKPDHTSYAN